MALYDHHKVQPHCDTAAEEEFWHRRHSESELRVLPNICDPG